MIKLVQVLWGSDFPGSRWRKIQADIEKAFKDGLRLPTTVFVYGKHNADLLHRRSNCKVELVDRQPYPDGKEDHPLKNRGSYRPWHYKWELIQAALETIGPRIIYTDWDVKCNTDDLRRIESKLVQPIMLSAFRYRRRQHGERPCPVESRMAASGNWVWMGDGWLAKAVLNEMWQNEMWHDEHALDSLIESRNGGWVGQAEWLRRYESPVMVQRNKRSPWRLLSDDGQTVVRETPVPFVWERLFSQ